MNWPRLSEFAWNGKEPVLVAHMDWDAEIGEGGQMFFGLYADKPHNAVLPTAELDRSFLEIGRAIINDPIAEYQSFKNGFDGRPIIWKRPEAA